MYSMQETIINQNQKNQNHSIMYKYSAILFVVLAEGTGNFGKDVLQLTESTSFASFELQIISAVCQI